jgi:hypothetical protein
MSKTKGFHKRPRRNRKPRSTMAPPNASDLRRIARLKPVGQGQAETEAIRVRMSADRRVARNDSDPMAPGSREIRWSPTNG